MTFKTILLLLALSAAAFADINWPEFRGPRGDGTSDSPGVPTSWSETKNVKWKTPIPGQGWSSPVVWGEQIWMTTATNAGQSRRAICVDKTSGKIIHDVEVFHVSDVEPKNEVNSHASPTLVIEDGRVYVSFGTNGSACLDTATSKILWTNTDLKIDHKEGPGSSPILYRNLFILHCDGCDLQYIVALDKMTGKIVWKTNRSSDSKHWPYELRKAFSIPLIVTEGGEDRLISVGAHRVYGYDPLTGKELWFCDHPGFSNPGRPIWRDGILYFGTGYMKAELWAVRTTGAKGDVSKTNVAWKFGQGVSLKPSFVLAGDELFMAADNGIIRSMNAKTGTVNWQKRIGTTYSASPTLVGGLVYLFCEQGEMTVLRPGGKEPQVVAENRLEEGCMASPAIIGKAMFVRTKGALYRIED